MAGDEAVQLSWLMVIPSRSRKSASHCSMLNVRFMMSFSRSAMETTFRLLSIFTVAGAKYSCMANFR